MSAHQPAWTDVSALPTTTFGHRNLGWWATLGFVVIEGTTLFICAVSYFYLRRNFQHWPPYGTPRPDLLAPAIQVALMLLSWWPMRLADRAARRLDLAAVRRWLVVLTLFAVAFCVLRWFEIQALHTRWDTNAYGSIVWTLLGLHTVHLLTDAFDTGVLGVLLVTGPLEGKRFGDVAENAMYWNFVVLAWIPIYLVIYIAPRVI